MKVETTTVTSVLVQCTLEEFLDPSGLKADRRKYAPETTFTSAFIGKHDNKYCVHVEVGEKGIIKFWAYITDPELLVRFMSLEPRTRHNFFLFDIKDLMDKHEGNVTIEIEVMWGLMDHRIIKIEKEVFQNQSFIYTLSLVWDPNPPETFAH